MERIDLYSHQHPPGAALPVLVAPAPVVDEIPTDEEISVVVLLPKSDGGHRGIGLLEVIWKVLMSAIDVRMKTTITFHDALHGFRAKRGTGTAVFEAKLFQQLASIEQVPVFEVFLDLKKAYDTVDRARTLQLLEQYGVGPLALRLLRQFWDRQRIVARQGGFYGDPFEASRGVTQGAVESSTIFNVVVDAVVRYWLTLVVNDGSDADTGLGLTVNERLVLFYADDGLIASRNSEWLQMAIQSLSELFERVGLRTNTTKTETMNCTPGYISGPMSASAYKRRMDGEGQSHRARQRQRVTCPHCGKALAAGSLAHHVRTQHGLLPEADAGRIDAPGRQPAEYRMSFPRTTRKALCPVDGCPGNATTHANLRRHFMYRHPKDTLVVLEEGLVPLPRCELCGMHVTPATLSSSHRQMTLCREGADRARQRSALEDARRAREVVLSIQGVQLKSASVFKYLGRPLSSTDDDWPAVYHNLSKARQRWTRVSRVLTREGAGVRTAASFYKAIVQSVLLYGSETWVVTPAVLKVLNSFHHRVARKLSGKQPRFIHSEDRWFYPPLEEALEATGLYTLRHYIDVRRNTLITNIATRPILQLCRQAGRRSGSVPKAFWWNYLSEE
jgi:hypothetical protein